MSNFVLTGAKGGWEAKQYKSPPTLLVTLASVYQ